MGLFLQVMDVIVREKGLGVMDVLDVISAGQTDSLGEIFQLVRKGSLFDESSFCNTDFAQSVVGGRLSNAKFL